MIDKLDKIRGEISREEFLEKLLDSNPEDESNESDDREENNPSGTAGNDRTALEKLDVILSKINQIDDLNSRLEELENNQEELSNNLKELGDKFNVNSPTSSTGGGMKSGKSGNNNFIEANDGKKIKTFNFSSEKSASPGPQIDNLDRGNEQSEDTFEGSDDYNFVFGCWYCNNTVKEMDTICPSCGNQLEGQPSGTEWLEQVGDNDENFYQDDDWDEERDFSDDITNEDYDPSITSIIYDNPDSQMFGRVGPSGYREFGQRDMNLNIPPCTNCGGNTEYIERYDRWYCYKCSTYLPRMQSQSAVEADNNSVRKDKTRVLENIINRRHTKTRNGRKGTDERPLMYYGPYASSDVVTKISMLEDDDEPVIKKKIIK